MIIYFSGTGNSFSIAKKLGARINEPVVPLKKAIIMVIQLLLLYFLYIVRIFRRM
jgi:flavodoxin